MVNIINCNISDFSKRIENKRLVCFGAGRVFESFLKNYRDFNFENKIEFIIDNNENLAGTFKNFNGKNMPIISFSQFISSIPDNIAVLITNIVAFDEMLSQLDDEPVLNGVECYISSIFGFYYNAEAFEFTKGEYPKIPKKIHYCWFGGNPIPVHLQKFIESWSKFCPDYEIIKWEESNYDINKNRYMKQAYEAKKWGFVPDYARLDIIYNFGGIYLDTDVEIVKPLDDLLYDEMFCGFESKSHIAFGLGFGAVMEHPILKSMMEQYDKLNFLNEDGSLNLTASPQYQSEILSQYGFKLNNEYQNINGVAVYPTEVFCPINILKCVKYFTMNTHSIHHYEASWVKESELKKMREFGMKFRKIFERLENISSLQENIL
jgi:mannosyltransferase OCH1-like enzyme